MSFKFRFSIRSILLLTALVAATAWWLTSPTAMARRFASAIDKAKYDEAAALFLVDGEAAMLTDWQPLVEAHAVPNRLTVSDLIRGRRAIYLSVTYQAKVSDISGFFPLEADFRGIYKLDMRAKDMDRFQETTLPKQVDGR